MLTDREEFDRLLGALIGLHVKKTYEIARGGIPIPGDRTNDPEIRAAYVALIASLVQRNEVLEEAALKLEDIDALCAEEVRAMKERT